MRYLASDIFKKISIYILTVSLVISGKIIKGEDRKESIGWEKRGEVFMRVYQDTIEDSRYETNQEIDSRFKWKNKFKFRSFPIILGINLEARYQALVGEDTEKDLDLLLKEAYLKFTKPSYSLKIGRQTVTWGKLDDIIVLDRVNPQEYKWFILWDKQERKIPVFMAKYDYYGNNYQIETVIVPFFKPSYVRFFGSDWAVFGHLKEVIEDGSYSQSIKNIIKSIKVHEKDRFSEQVLENMQGGIRVKGTFKGIDWSIYYMYFYNDTPTLRERTSKGNTVKKFLYIPTNSNLSQLVAQNPSGDDLILDREYSRLHIIGVDFETVAGNYGLRGELGFFYNKPFLRENFSYIEKNTLCAGIGIDHTTSGNLYWNLQFIEDIVFSYENLFSQEEYSHQITSTFSKDFLRGKLTFGVDSSYRISYHDWMVNPNFTYNFNGRLSILVGGFIFEGASTTLFGRYAKKDVIYFQTTYKF